MNYTDWCTDKGISIHAAREGGDVSRTMLHCQRVISIHAAREGGAVSRTMLPCQRVISIHAAREGGDCHGLHASDGGFYFNPRRP